MRASDLLRSAVEARGTTQKALAEMMGVKESRLSKCITDNSLKAQELVDAAEALGYTPSFIDRQTEQPMVVLRRGSGPRLRKQINGTVYDTEKSSALCRTPVNDGWWLELYQTPSGELFVAHYTEWQGIESFITLCPREEALKLLEVNGEDAL